MVYKAIIMSIKDNDVIVMTDEKQFLRIKKKEGILIGQKIMFTEEDILLNNTTLNNRKGMLSMSKKYFATIASVLVLLIVGFVGFNYFNNEEKSDDPNMLSENAVSVVTIDINPSVELFLNENNEVIDIQSLNEDASTLDLSSIIGLSAENAVEEIILLAKASGFIDDNDLDEDFILLTIVDMDEADNIDTLQLKEALELKAQNSLEYVNVAMLKATVEELLAAQEKDIPVGLYIINGMIQSDNGYITVKEFFANSQNREVFAQKGEVIAMSSEIKRKLAEKYIDELSNASVDVLNIKTMLDDPNINIEDIISQVKSEWSKYESAADNAKNNNENITSDEVTPQLPTGGNQNSQREAATVEQATTIDAINNGIENDINSVKESVGANMNKGPR